MSFSFRKKIFALVVSCFMFVILGSSSTFAMTLTVTNRSHGVVDANSVSELMRLNGNENFSVTLKATDTVGTSIRWQLAQSMDYDLDTYKKMQTGYTPTETEMKHLSTVNLSYSGDTATISGTFSPESGMLVLTCAAWDLDSEGKAAGDPTTSFASYLLEIVNNGTENNSSPVPTPTPNPQGNNETQELEHAVISPVKLSDDVIEQIAENINVESSEIKLLTSRDFTTATPPEPTDTMKQQAKDDGYEFIAKLNTINVSEDGWYIFKVTVSDDLVGTKVSDLRLYYAEDEDFIISSASGQARAAFGLMPLINGVTGGFEVTNLFGVKLDTLPKQFLATMFLSASKSMTVYIVKILIALLTGCNAGFGLMGAAVGAFLVWKYFRKH